MNCRAAARATAVLVLAAAPLAACDRGDAEGSDCPAAMRANTVSGYCVPRWVSLKHDEVYGRKGPGKDYPAVWVYRARGLPVQIVAETSEWRRVCDPYGGASWINRSMVAGRRTVLSLGPGPVDLQKTPKASAPRTGMMAGRALANLDRCEAGWCKVKVAGLTGWAPAGSFWGVAPASQCR
ncbi:MAG TPA: SH3 domain-containing protein [Caulobacteraceae bacterium]|nr:SH3 domain-containing protein [Caulobacteraceae bacterium]